MTRKARREASNNVSNPNKNVCGTAVAKALGCETETRYLHTISDLVYCLRKRFTVRSRGASTKGKSVGAIRRKCEKLAAAVGGRATFIVHVPGHVLLLGANGKTLIDTDGKKRDRRKIQSLYVVYPK